MAELKVTFTLSDRDLNHLRRLMRKVSTSMRDQSDDSIIGSAVTMAAEVRKFKPPQYVLDRIGKLETLVRMLRDEQYGLPVPVRKKVLSAVAYFTNPHDLIPDPVPGLGFLDDAIMIELVTQDLRHELDAYRDFCRFRDRPQQRPWTRVAQETQAKKLLLRRRELRRRIEDRQAKALGASKRSGIYRLW